MTFLEAKPGVDADEAIDALIERRAQEAQEQERVEASWAESVRNFNLRARAERRKEWADYHNALARLHRRLADEHDEAVRRLIDGAAP